MLHRFTVQDKGLSTKMLIHDPINGNNVRHSAAVSIV